jgi:hypothetical protein
VRSVHEALGIYTHDVHCRWGSRLLAVVGAVIRGRLPVIGQPNADNPISFTTARRPRTRTAERLLAGPRRGRRCTPALCAGPARAAAGL